AEARGEVIAAALEKDDVEAGMPRGHLVQRVEVQRGVLADGGVRTPAGLHADDPIGRQGFAADEKLHFLAREDVVGDDAEPILLAHRLAQGVDERGFAGADRSTDADANGFVHLRCVTRQPRRQRERINTEKRSNGEEKGKLFSVPLLLCVNPLPPSPPFPLPPSPPFPLPPPSPFPWGASRTKQPRM